MKRLLAALVAAALVGLLGTGAQARDLDRPEPGCHRVYVSVPGGSQPIEVTICP